MNYLLNFLPLPHLLFVLQCYHNKISFLLFLPHNSMSIFIFHYLYPQAYKQSKCPLSLKT